MVNEERLLDLLAEIDYQREIGQPVTPEQLCQGDEELLAALRERLGARSSLDRTPVSDANRPPDTSPLPSLKGYSVTEQIGQGRLGIVYQARAASGRPVAAKLLLCGGFVEESQRPQLEAGLLALKKCRHASLVELLDWGNYDGCLYLILEHCPGGDLSGRLRQGPLSARDAAGLVEALARGLHHAHQQGIVHGHLSPHHILWSADGSARIADLGLVPLLEAVSAPLLLRPPAGRLGYRAPEQDQPGADRPAADVYALGAILRECLAGQLPPGLKKICKKCLEPQPPRRYATAAQLAEDLAELLAGTAGASSSSLR
jgi:serine/threonine protein kinase